MSAQTIDDAFFPVDALYRAEVYKATWGHCAPQKNKSSDGFIVFALGCYEGGALNPTVLQCDLAGMDDSPWFYDAMIDFLQGLGGEEGEVYHWSGVFRNYKFKGVVTHLALDIPRKELR